MGNIVSRNTSGETKDCSTRCIRSSCCACVASGQMIAMPYETWEGAYAETIQVCLSRSCGSGPPDFVSETVVKSLA